MLVLFLWALGRRFEVFASNGVTVGLGSGVSGGPWVRYILIAIAGRTTDFFVVVDQSSLTKFLFRVTGLHFHEIVASLGNVVPASNH